MNGYSEFANSRQAGDAVVWIVGCGILSLLLLAWILAQLAQIRRDRTALDLRRDRAARRRLEAVGGGLRPAGTPALRLAHRMDGPGRQRSGVTARAAGVDELMIESPELWAEYSTPPARRVH